ncbi:MAG: tyrosine-type recombinase/integrase [Candidatus Kapabacteria bacterium]|nr:tyrosine-type recombinase/integrase [Candidatus Kapabacteria bacterium]
MYIKIGFYLDNYNVAKSSICMSFYINGKRYSFSIKMSLPVEYWDKKLQLASPKYSLSTTINSRIYEIKTFCERHYVLSNQVGIFQIDGFLGDIKEFIKGKPNKDNKNDLSKSFFNLWLDFINYKKENGLICHKVVLLYERSKRFLFEFRKETTFECIDERFLIEFRTFLIKKKDYEINGTTPILKNALLVFLNWATANGYNNNMKYKNFKISNTEKHHNVYLSLKELERIKNIENLPPYLENTRNWMMIMSYTGLRVSDALRLDNSNVNLKEKTIDIIAQKTKSRVIIPIISLSLPYIEKLLNNEVYKISEQKLNNYYKELCKLASIDNKITVSTFKLKKTEQILPKYELITNHSFRRSFATNSLSLGIQPSNIMKITGHKTLSSFENYIGFTVQNAVDEVSKAWNSIS